jgi:uncharacterized protein (TIGR00297 family)
LVPLGESGSYASVSQLKIKQLGLIAAVFLDAGTARLGLFALVTLAFAAFGWAVRGVTRSGAMAGAVVCFALLAGSGWAGFAGLCTVFMVTWAATRCGYARKQSLGTAEARSGRTAAQVIANLGVATLCAGALVLGKDPRFFMALGAALAEAAADTVSSEIGQAIGGTPRLVTQWTAVPPGTDGAVTVAGTAAGIGAALAVIAVFAFAMPPEWHGFVVCATAGIAGTFADSLLGATLERRGLIGNNGVNFLSTLVAAGAAFVIA